MLVFIYKRVKYFSIDWRKEKGRENINRFVFSYIFLIAKLAKTLAKISQNYFFGFFGQLLALFLAKYIKRFNWLCNYHRRVKKTLYIALLYTVHIHFDCYPKRDYNIGDETFNSKSQLWCIVYTKTCLGASLFIFFIENINF